MKKIFTFVLIVFAITTYAQKLEKIKGSKNVTLSERSFDELKYVELNKDINIVLTKGEENKLLIYADDNLHEIVETDIEDGDLSISLSNRISSKKKFELTLQITESTLSKLILNENSVINNHDFIKTDNLKINLFDKASANLLFTADSVQIELNDKSKGEMSVRGEKINFNIQETAKLKINLDVKKIVLICDQKANITITGKAEVIDIEAKNTSKVKAANLKVKDSNIIAENSVLVYTNTSENLKVSAESKSKVYIYDNPKIIIESFKGTASLIKKE